MHGLSELLTRLMPNGLKDRIRGVIGDFFRFKHTLTSGILIVVRRPADFSTYSELFVDGFYDRAIHDSIKESSDEINLLDLGSNVGYFAHRFADVLWGKYPEIAKSKSVKVTMVEGTKSVADESLYRISNNPDKLGQCEVIHGLVGKRDGFDYISTEYNYGYNSITDMQRKGRRVKTSYYDLQDRLTKTKFDLIKCDIEGAEESFLVSYADVLALHKRVVV